MKRFPLGLVTLGLGMAVSLVGGDILLKTQSHAQTVPVLTAASAPHITQYLSGLRSRLIDAEMQKTQSMTD